MKALPNPSLNGSDITVVSFRLPRKLVPPLPENVANESYLTLAGSLRRSSHVTPIVPLALVFSHGKNWSCATLAGATPTPALQVAPPSAECVTSTRIRTPSQL